jgi:hypothetical protein
LSNAEPSPLVGLGIHGVSFDSTIRIHDFPGSTNTITTTNAPVGLGIHGVSTTGLVGISNRMQSDGVSETMLTELEGAFACPTNAPKGLGITGVRSTGLVGINAFGLSTPLSQTMLTQLEDKFMSSHRPSYAPQHVPCGLGITGVSSIGLVGISASQPGLSKTILTQLEDEFSSSYGPFEHLPHGLGLGGVSGNGVVGLNARSSESTSPLSHTMLTQLEDVFTSPSFPIYYSGSAFTPIDVEDNAGHITNAGRLPLCGLGLMTNGVELSDGTGIVGLRERAVECAQQVSRALVEEVAVTFRTL